MLDAIIKSVVDGLDTNTKSNIALSAAVGELTQAVLAKTDGDENLASLIVTALGGIAADQSAAQIAESGASNGAGESGGQAANNPAGGVASKTQGDQTGANSGGGSASDAINPVSPNPATPQVTDAAGLVKFVTAESNFIEHEMNDRQTALNMITALTACGVAAGVQFMQELPNDKVIQLMPILQQDLNALKNQGIKAFAGICQLANIAPYPQA